MDYKEKYTREDALRDLQGFIGQLTEGCQKAIKTLIPELSESEDERIRKGMISYIGGLNHKEKAKWIAYLEKQKEQEQEPEEDDFTVYHPLKCNGEYECFAYSFRGSLTAFSDKKDLLEFLRTCFYTEQECEEWIKSQKCQKPTPRWMIDFLDEIRTCSVVGKEKYEDYDGRREFEAHCLAIIRWLEGHYIEQKEQKGSLRVIKDASEWEQIKEQKPVEVNDEWIEDYWEHEKVNNPYSYNKGDEIQFDHNGFVRFCKRYCQKPAGLSDEDERIRKWIIGIVNGCKELSFKDKVKLTRWLEKQKEQKFADETMEEKDRIDSAFTKMMQKEQKPVEQITDAEMKRSMDAVRDFKVFVVGLARDFNITITHERDIDWHNFCAGLLTYLERNKPAERSEEDIKKIRSEEYTKGFNDAAFGGKLKEWSVKDEDRIRQIERIAQQAGCSQKLQEEIHDWLKSLRNRPIKADTWKPSENKDSKNSK